MSDSALDQEPARQRVTLAYSNHRVETLALAAPRMREHRVVALEEPPVPEFEEMLSGAISIDDYLLATDYEYPEFARRSCTLQRELAADDISLLQIEPFLETLAAIHDFFSSGGLPDQIESGSARRAVYEAERQATAALIDYYRTCIDAPFETVLRAVQRFSRADVARGILRDGMRARALARIAKRVESVYVEAGYIHYALAPELERALPDGCKLEVIHLMGDGHGRLIGGARVCGPGDELTRLYAEDLDASGPDLDLLAARALIHAKIVYKEELLPSPEHPFPHRDDEIETTRLTDRLDLSACERLFDRIRRCSAADARRIVRESSRA